MEMKNQSPEEKRRERKQRQFSRRDHAETRILICVGGGLCNAADSAWGYGGGGEWGKAVVAHYDGGFHAGLRGMVGAVYDIG